MVENDRYSSPEHSADLETAGDTFIDEVSRRTRRDRGKNRGPPRSREFFFIKARCTPAALAISFTSNRLRLFSSLGLLFLRPPSDATLKFRRSFKFTRFAAVKTERADRRMSCAINCGPRLAEPTGNSDH